MIKLKDYYIKIIKSKNNPDAGRPAENAEARSSLSDSHVRRGKARQMQERALEQRTKSTAIHRRPGKMVRPI